MGGCCQTGGGGCRPPRLPSVLCAILCCAAYTTALLSGVTCTFLRVYNTPIDNAPIVADAPSEFYDTAFPPNYSLGVYCPPPHSSVEVDTLWLTARIFLSVGLTIGLINLALSLATCTPLMSPNKTNWKAMGVLSALAGSVQVPAFLMFDSSSCHHRSGEERYYTSTCQMDLGSFLLVCSVAIQLCITAFTQCVDAPEYDVEEERKLDAWRKNDGRDAKSWDMSSVTAPGTPLSRSSDINDVEIGRRQDEAMKRATTRGNCLSRCWSGCCLGLKDRGRSDAGGVNHGGKGREMNDGGVDDGDDDAAVAAAVGSVAAVSRARRGGKKRKPTKRAKAGPPLRHVRSTSEGSRSVEVLKRSATQLAEDDDVEALELDQVDEEDEEDDDDEISQMRRSGPYDEESGRDLLGIEASPLRRKASEQRIDGSKAAGVPTMASERTLQTSNHRNDKNNEANGVRVGLVEQRRREVSARLLGTSSATSTHNTHEGGETNDEVGVEQALPKATTPQRRSIQEKKRGDHTASSSTAAAAVSASEGRPPPSPRKASRSVTPTAGEGGSAMTTSQDRREMEPPVRREMATDQEMPPPPQRQSLSSRIASMFRGGDRAYDVMNDSGSSVVSSNHGDSSVVRNAAVAAAAANHKPEQEILRGGSRRHVQMRLSGTNKQTISMMDVVAVRQSSVADMSVENVSVVGGGSVVVTPSYDNEDGGSSCYTTASEGGDDRDDGATDLTDSGAAAGGNADLQDEDAASEAPFDEGRPPSVDPTARNVGGASGDVTSTPRSASADDDDGIASSVQGGGAPSEVPFDELLDRARRGVALGHARRASSVSASKTRGVGGRDGGGGCSPRSLTKEAWRNNRRGHSVAPSAPSHVVGASASLTTKKTPPRTPVNTDRVGPRSTALTTPESSKGPPGRGGVQEQPSTPIGSREGNNAASRRRGRSVTPRTTEASSTGQRPREEEQGAHKGEEEEQNPSVPTGVVKSTSSTPRRGRSVSALRSVWEGNKDQPSPAGVAPSPMNNNSVTPQRRRGNSVTPGVSRDEKRNGPLIGVTTSSSRNAIPPSPSRRNQTQSIARTPERRRNQSVTPGSTRTAAESGTPETALEDDPDHRQSTAGASPVISRSAPSRERRGQSISATSRGQSVNRNNGPTPPRSRSVAPPGSPWTRGGGQPAAASDEARGSSSLTPSRRGRSSTPRSRAMAGAAEGGRQAASIPPPPSSRDQDYRQRSSETAIGSIGDGRNEGDEEDEDRQSAVGSYLDRLGKKTDAARHDKDTQGRHAAISRSSSKLTTPPRSTPPPPPPTRTPGTSFEKAKNETDYSEEAVSRTSSAVVSPDVSPSSTTGSSHDEIASPPRRHHPPMPTSSSFFRRTNPSPSPNHRYGSVKSYGTSATSPRSGKVAGTTIEPSPKGVEHDISGDRARTITPERSEPPTGEGRAASPPRIAPSSSSHGAPPRYGSLVDARKQMFERNNHRSDDSSEASSALNGSRSVSVSRRRPPQQHVSQSPHRRGSSSTPQPRSEMDKVSII